MSPLVVEKHLAEYVPASACSFDWATVPVPELTGVTAQLAIALSKVSGNAPAEGLALADGERDGLTLGEILDEGDKDGLGLGDKDGLTEGETEDDGDKDGLTEGETEADGDKDGETDGDTDELPTEVAGFRAKCIPAQSPEVMPVTENAFDPDDPAEAWMT